MQAEIIQRLSARGQRTDDDDYTLDDAFVDKSAVRMPTNKHLAKQRSKLVEGECDDVVIYEVLVDL